MTKPKVRVIRNVRGDIVWTHHEDVQSFIEGIKKDRLEALLENKRKLDELWESRRLTSKDYLARARARKVRNASR